jgi:DNA-binding NarL/FixJ family response regulator
VQKTTVTIMDRHAILRDGLTLRLSVEPDLQVVATASSANQVIGMVLKHRPDVLVLDGDIGEETCADLLVDLKSIEPHPRSILLTSREDAASTTAAIRMGASACVLKMAPIEDLITAIRWVGRGEMWVSPPLLVGLATGLQEPTAASESSSRLEALTPREMEILDLMVEGLNHAELARRLHVTVNTVRTHTRNIQIKLDVHSNLSAVAVALQAGVRPNEADPAPRRQHA